MTRIFIMAVLMLLMFSSGDTHAYETVQVKEGATIRGVVVFNGTVPSAESVRIDRDTEVCGEKQSIDKYIVSDRKVKNVVVWLEGVDKGKRIPIDTVNITISNCRIEPLVSVGFVGGKYRFRNEDPLLHTLQLKLGLKYHKEVSKRPLANGATIYNLAFPKKGQEIERPIKRYHRFTDKTGFVRITSNTHTWMRGYIFVFDHPYATVTDEQGRFVIDNIPPGEYILRLWHEGAGFKDRKIRIRPGEVKEIEIDIGSQEAKKTEAAPSISFENTRYSFGTISEGEIVSHDFGFVNEGSGVLRILDLIPA